LDWTFWPRPSLPGSLKRSQFLFRFTLYLIDLYISEK
jgi:hypothetical protein